MIDSDPFDHSGGAETTAAALKAKSSTSRSQPTRPGPIGHGFVRVWNDDELAPTPAFPAHPNATWKSITLFPRKATITPIRRRGKKGRNRGRRRAGDERREVACSLGYKSGAPPRRKASRIWIEPPPKAASRPGTKPFRVDRARKIVTSPAVLRMTTMGAGRSAPTRACAPPRLKAGESADDAPGSAQTFLCCRGRQRRVTAIYSSNGPRTASRSSTRRS